MTEFMSGEFTHGFNTRFQAPWEACEIVGFGVDEVVVKFKDGVEMNIPKMRVISPPGIAPAWLAWREETA